MAVEILGMFGLPSVIQIDQGEEKEPAKKTEGGEQWQRRKTRVSCPKSHMKIVYEEGRGIPIIYEELLTTQQ